MARKNLADDEKAVNVSKPEAMFSVQCVEVKLGSSVFHALDKTTDQEKESNFTFKIDAQIESEIAFSNLEVQIVYVISEDKNAPIHGFFLRFSLIGTFMAVEPVSKEALSNFVEMYTLSILWPYAREYASDQFRRAGEAFDSLPIINPQVITEHLIKAGLVSVEIVSEESEEGEVTASPSES